MKQISAAPLVGALLTQLLARVAFQFAQHDLQQDFEIWRHKRDAQPPVLARGDGPIMLYREWAARFYPQPPVARALPLSGRSPRRVTT